VNKKAPIKALLYYSQILLSSLLNTIYDLLSHYQKR